MNIEKDLEEVTNIGYHINKQEIEMQPLKIYIAGREQFKNKFGSSRELTGLKYHNRENNKHNSAINYIWDIYESKIKYNKEVKYGTER